MVEASACQAGERALPAGRLLAGGCPSQHLWERHAELGGAPGLHRGLCARGPRPALRFPHRGLGTWGSYWGSTAAEKASVASAGSQCPLGLHTGWAPAPGAPGTHGCPPAGPPSLSLLADTAALPSAPPHLRVRRPAPLSSGGWLWHVTDPLSFALSCFPWCPVTLWETGRQGWPGPEPGGQVLGLEGCSRCWLAS